MGRGVAGLVDVRGLVWVGRAGLDADLGVDLGLLRVREKGLGLALMRCWLSGSEDGISVVVGEVRVVSL